VDAGLPGVELEAHGQIAPTVGKTRRKPSKRPQSRENPAFSFRIVKFGGFLNLKSDRLLVIANFAFPSRYSEQDRIWSEIEAVHRCLRPGGKLITIGWDETFNDELNEMWYRFVPDGITARNFEEWRQSRAAGFHSARNSQLTWFRRRLRVNLQFPSVDSAARVMGYLFGRSAIWDVLHKHKTTWTMSLGITVDTREQLKTILDKRSEKDLGK